MNTEIQSNELIENKRVTVLKTTTSYIDDLQSLNKAINNYISAYTSNESVPDTAPHKKSLEDQLIKAEAELNLQLTYVNIYNSGGNL